MEKIEMKRFVIVGTMLVSFSACSTGTQVAEKARRNTSQEAKDRIAQRLKEIQAFETERSVAAVQSETVPFGHFKKKLTIKKGISYLEFMRTQVKPALDSFDADIRELQEKYPKQYSRWQKELIAEGKGVAIRIDKDDYFFNVGYNNGDNSDDVKSGRSYGVGPRGRQSDPSDVFYLKELQKFLKEGSAADRIAASKNFYQAIMLLLTDCDTSGWKNLSILGREVATDFLAIYTAESDRHLMVGLAPRQHPWEIDLVAATFVSVFNVQTGLMMQEGEFVEGGIENWWAPGQTGSGIGITRDDRKKLTRIIGDYMSKHEDGSKIVAEIEALIGETNRHDVIQGVFEYLNQPPEGPTDLKPAKLTKAMVKFQELLRANADEIAQ